VFAFSFGVMGLNWQDLTIKGTLYSEIAGLSSMFNSQGCSNIIYGLVSSVSFLLANRLCVVCRLALCDVDYRSLPENIKIVFSRFLRKVEEGIPQGISNAIFGLSKMDVSWEELDEEMCLSIERMIEKRKDDFSIQVS
jgi:hypothetical protein